MVSEGVLEVRPEGRDDVGLAFRIRNASPERVVIRYLEPFLSFDLTAESDAGPVRIVRPAFDVAGRLATVAIEPGEEFRIWAPIRLRFDPEVDPSGGVDRTRWTLVTPATTVQLRAAARVHGASLPPCVVTLAPAAFS